jgi:hypothetical protein
MLVLKFEADITHKDKKLKPISTPTSNQATQQAKPINTPISKWMKLNPNY